MSQFTLDMQYSLNIHLRAAVVNHRNKDGNKREAGTGSEGAIGTTERLPPFSGPQHPICSMRDLDSIDRGT